MDNYLVSLNEAGKITVGVPYTFAGTYGPKIESLSLFIDGFELPGMKMLNGVWTLNYSFQGAGLRKLLLISEGVGGSAKINRTQTILVEAGTSNKVEPVKYQIVSSEIRHLVKWRNPTIGVIVHHSASHQIEDPTPVLQMGVDNRYTYDVMASNGVVYTTTSLNEHGSHAGVPEHRNHRGIEILSVGLLTKVGSDYYAWFDVDSNGSVRPGKKPWPKEKTRYFPGGKDQVAGYYGTYTEDQEKSLVEYIRWIKDKCPGFKIDNVIGHDEVCFRNSYPGAKNDPGGSLSMSMPAFREYLKKVL